MEDSWDDPFSNPRFIERLNETYEHERSTLRNTHPLRPQYSNTTHGFESVGIRPFLTDESKLSDLPDDSSNESGKSHSSVKPQEHAKTKINPKSDEQERRYKALTPFLSTEILISALMLVPVIALIYYLLNMPPEIISKGSVSWQTEYSTTTLIDTTISTYVQTQTFTFTDVEISTTTKTYTTAKMETETYTIKETDIITETETETRTVQEVMTETIYIPETEANVISAATIMHDNSTDPVNAEKVLYPGGGCWNIASDAVIALNLNKPTKVNGVMIHSLKPNQELLIYDISTQTKLIGKNTGNYLSLNGIELTKIAVRFRGNTKLCVQYIEILGVQQ